MTSTETQAQPYAVVIWTHAESVRFLRDQVGSDVDVDALASTFFEFGPALEIVGAVAAALSHDSGELGALVENARSAVGDIDVAGRYHWAARVALELALGRIKHANKAGMADFTISFLTSFAYLSPSIPNWIFEHSESQDPLKPLFDEFVRFRIVSFDRIGMWFDPILQHAMRRRPAQSPRQYLLAAAVLTVDQAIRAGESARPPFTGNWSALLACADALFGHIESEPHSHLDSSTTAGLAFAVSKRHQEDGDVSAAKEMYRRGIEIEERCYGPDHADVGVSYGTFGDRLRKMRDLEGARDAYRRSVEIGTKCYFPNDGRVGMRLAKLGNVLRDLRDFTAARVAYERSVEIGEASLDGEEQTPLTSARLAEVYGDDLDELESDLRAHSEYLKSLKW